MAARLSLEGAAANTKVWDFAPNEKELVKISVEEQPVAIVRRNIPGLLSSRLFLSSWTEWSRYRRFGLPHAAGWKRERAIVIRMIEVMEQEYDAFLADQRE